MAYTDLSATFVYKSLLTYQQMDGLGENDKYFKEGDASVSGQWTYSHATNPITFGTAIARDIIVDASKFVPISNTETWLNLDGENNGYSPVTHGFTPNTAGGDVTMIAPVDVPLNATITGLSAAYYVNDINSLAYCYIYSNSSAGVATKKGSADTSGGVAGDRWVDSADLTSFSRSSTNSAHIRVRLDTNMAIGDIFLIFCKVIFTVTKPLP